MEMMSFQILLRCLAITLAVSPATIVFAASKATIPQIQGPGHSSPFSGKMVAFEGVVMLLRDGTFFVQDPAGDGDDKTSDGILVRRKPTGLTVGDLVSVEGTVD